MVRALYSRLCSGTDDHRPHIAAQGNRKLSDLATLRMWLIEHLGVAYRGYLELDPVTLEPSAKIAVTVGQSSLLVPPIPVPMMLARTEKLEVELGGQIVPLTYIHGILDKTKREHLVQGNKTRYYYQCSQPTQGIDIRLGKRVIATAQLERYGIGMTEVQFAVITATMTLLAS